MARLSFTYALAKVRINSSMKVTISVGGQFQAFQLAKQLEKRGFLKRLITSYPRSLAAIRASIPKDKVTSLILKELLERGWSKLPKSLQSLYNPQFMIHEVFDRQAARRLSTTDIFTGWSSFSLHSMRRAKELGAVTVIERGSSHILYQNEVLTEEYARWGHIPKAFEVAHKKIIEKELQEYAEADAIAIPSSYVRRTFLDQGIPEAKLIQVPYGVDLSVFHQVPKEDDVFRVIFGGGLSLRKGTHYLLQAFSELNLPNSELLLIGAVNEEIKPFLEKYEGKYKHMTYRPMPQLHKYFSQGSAFVMPSIEEGLAMVQPMAMACGLPVVCTTNTGGEDIVRDGVDGFVIPIRSVEKIKEKILFLYEHPDICKAMGQSAKQRVASGFTWDDYGDKMIAMYQKILAKKNNV
jgi:glycosyltransferase involved in cell wall biosynthesis